MDYNFEVFSVSMENVKQLGITILTGEADALSMRLLCELTPEAMDLFLEYTGLRIDKNLIPKNSYNSNDKWAMFLTWEQMEDMLIMNWTEEYGYVLEIISENKHKKLYC
jgi:hypothetical protein